MLNLTCHIVVLKFDYADLLLRKYFLSMLKIIMLLLNIFVESVIYILRVL